MWIQEDAITSCKEKLCPENLERRKPRIVNSVKINFNDIYMTSSLQDHMTLFKSYNPLWGRAMFTVYRFYYIFVREYSTLATSETSLEQHSKLRKSRRKSVWFW